MAIFFSIASDFIHAIWSSWSLIPQYLLGRNAFLRRVLMMKYKNLVIGDCLLSAFFRARDTSLLPRPSVHLFVFLIFGYLQVGYQIRYLRKLRQKPGRYDVVQFNFRDYWFSRGVGGGHLIKINIDELRYSIYHQGFRAV